MGVIDQIIVVSASCYCFFQSEEFDTLDHRADLRHSPASGVLSNHSHVRLRATPTLVRGQGFPVHDLCLGWRGGWGLWKRMRSWGWVAWDWVGGIVGLFASFRCFQGLLRRGRLVLASASPRNHFDTRKHSLHFLLLLVGARHRVTSVHLTSGHQP